MDINRFTQKAQEGISSAQTKAARYGHQQVDVEHLLAALLEQEGGLATSIFSKTEINTESFKRRVEQEKQRDAQMAGLISLTLLKLNEFAESRHWARSARVAADEAGEPTVQSWVRAQEAYAHYYSGSLSAAISVAEEAQAIAARRPCVGVALAAALEARAQAALGRPDETRAALRRARETLARLQGESLVPSAFGYNEAYSG